MRHGAPRQTCPLCAGERIVALVSPGARSMRSDGVIDPQPLGKWNCLSCGSVFRPTGKTFKQRASGDAYSLNAGEQTSFDAARHAGYAQALVRRVDREPATILDVGCGNGALLEQLRSTWPASVLRGVEPAHLPRLQAARRGLDVRPALDGSLSADLVVSVNVIEHTQDPAAFVRQLARAVRPQGTCILIWPDDRQASSELLFNDHLFTLSAATVQGLCSAAGLVGAEPVDAPPGFQGLRLRRRPMSQPRRRPAPRGKSRAAVAAFARQRNDYLLRWAKLDVVLQQRLEPDRIPIGFGIGEAAHTLRAYAPGLWERVAGLSADGATASEALGLPLLPADALDPQHHQVLLATHPKWHAELLRRFREAGLSCVAWDDLIKA